MAAQPSSGPMSELAAITIAHCPETRGVGFPHAKNAWAPALLGFPVAPVTGSAMNPQGCGLGGVSGDPKRK